MPPPPQAARAAANAVSISSQPHAEALLLAQQTALAAGDRDGARVYLQQCEANVVSQPLTQCVLFPQCAVSVQCPQPTALLPRRAVGCLRQTVQHVTLAVTLAVTLPGCISLSQVPGCAARLAEIRQQAATARQVGGADWGEPEGLKVEL